MADVRALLRQQRAARQIHHPYAAYSDAGKLLCTLCREQIRAETQWEAHLQSGAHKRLLFGLAAVGNEQDVATAAGGQKRKLGAAADDDEDAQMDDDAARRKRSKSDATLLNGTSTEAPGLIRRKSATPSQGVELQIPSRPTTPAHHRNRSSTSSAGPVTAPAPATTSSSSSSTTTSLPSRQASSLAIPASNKDNQPQPSSNAPTAPSTQQPPVDDAEWAAFEADIAAASAASAPYADEAVISRPAMTAEESAAAKEAAALAEDADSSRKSKVDVDIEDEREEATRALEEEFEEMHELEARVQRLKEKMEALRKRGESQGQLSAPTKSAIGLGHRGGKENLQMAIEHEEEADDDDDDEEDDWDGFRFRTR